MPEFGLLTEGMYTGSHTFAAAGNIFPPARSNADLAAATICKAPSPIKPQSNTCASRNRRKGKLAGQLVTTQTLLIVAVELSGLAAPSSQVYDPACAEGYVALVISSCCCFAPDLASCQSSVQSLSQLTQNTLDYADHRFSIRYD